MRIRRALLVLCGCCERWFNGSVAEPRVRVLSQWKNTGIDGPIAVMARWEIDPDQRASFVAAMEPIRRALKRQDALSFQLVEDVEQPGHMVETFTIATWAEYQRLPQRSTVDDSHLHDTLIEGFGPELPALAAHRVIRL